MTMGAAVLDRGRLATAADWLAVALAASLPLSTSLTAILAALWLLALLPTLDAASLRGVVKSPAGALPLALLLLGLAGMAWADVGWGERWHGFDSFLKLAAVPLLMVQFNRSERGAWVLVAYLAACALALVLSTAITLLPSLYWRDPMTFPTPFKNPATQSGEFVACIFVLLFVAIDDWRRQRRARAALLALLAAAFLNDIVFAATGRTALVVAVALLPLLALRQFRAAGVIAVLLAACVVGAALWSTSPYLRQRVGAVWTEIERYRTDRALTSSGERLEFWRKSLASIGRAPLIGHGTGSIAQQMRAETQGQTGPYATVTPNPHQQTLAVAMQLGLLGAAVLWAMWIAHLLLFPGERLAAWVGLVVVVQNIVGSLFNSHLFDFTQGWTYVVGVGVAGGMVLQGRRRERAGGGAVPP